MVGDEVVDGEIREGPFTNPWPALITGLGITLAAFLFSSVFTGPWFAGRLVLVGVGLLATGAAVVIRPQSPAVLGMAAFVALLASATVVERGKSNPRPETTVDGPDLTVGDTKANLPVQEGVAFSGVVTRFFRSGKDVPVEQYTASIDWGDGLNSPGMVVFVGKVNANSYFVVKGTKVYPQVGEYGIQVGIAENGKPIATVGRIAEVTKWDSAGLLLRVMTVVVGLSALVVLMPSRARRTVVSLIILFHFGGIFSAVTNIQPSPWLSAQAWTYVYRPYLQFMYLNNAYHFYSPDPGPACLIWFRVEYEPTEGQRHWRWVKVPEVDETGHPMRPDGTPLEPYVEYTRRLSISESINQPGPFPANFLEVQAKRMARASPVLGDLAIPLHPEILPNLQYHPLSPQSEEWLKTYVRHAAQEFKFIDKEGREHPELGVTGVKVYRVIHRIPLANQVAEHIDPDDPTSYLPFYEGEFDKNGDMLPGSQNDPTLYWLIPILREPKPGMPANPAATEKANPDDYVLKDYLKVHAGDEGAGGNEP